MTDEFFDLATHRGHFVSVPALASYLGVDRRTIVRMIVAKELPATRAGRAYRIPTDAARATFHVKQSQAS